MKKRIIILSLMLVLFVSCSSGGKSNDDSDIIPDDDLDSDDTETVNEDADLEEDVDFIEDSEVADEDTEDHSENPYFETYGEANYNVAYYYYGDAPTPSKDPENVKILWSENCGLKCEPLPYDLCAENYPFEPIVIPADSQKVPKDKEGGVGSFQCDAVLTPGSWYSNYSGSLAFNQFEGKVVYSLYHSSSWQSGGTYVYDLNTRKVERYGRTYWDGWQNKKYHFIATYDERVSSTIDETSPYFGQDYFYLYYYDKESDTYGFALKLEQDPTRIVDVRASGSYLFASLYFEDDSYDFRLFYTKIGEWDNWKELQYQREELYGNPRRVEYPWLNDNLLVYRDREGKIHLCDLEIGDSSCFQVAEGTFPAFKDKNTIVYHNCKSEDGNCRIFAADISDKNDIKYSELYNLGASQTVFHTIDEEGKYMAMKRNSPDPEDPENYNADIYDYCILRFSDKKLVCFDEPFDLNIKKNDGFIYQNKLIFLTIKDLVVRDLECYCDFYPEKCPLIDYTPDPENPKKPWGFDWKPEN